MHAKDYKGVLIFEISANKSAFEINEPITEKANSFFNSSVMIAVAGIIIAAVLLSVNQFYKPEKKPEPFKVQVIR